MIGIAPFFPKKVLTYIVDSCSLVLLVSGTIGVPRVRGLHTARTAPMASLPNCLARTASHTTDTNGNYFTNQETFTMTKKSINTESQTVVFDFGDDTIETFDLTAVTPEIMVQLALHGASQKIGDSYAGAKAACAESDIDPVDYAIGQVQGVIKQLLEGDWTVRTPGGQTVTDLANALAEAVGCPLEDAIARLTDADAEDKKALRAHPDIAAVLARIKSERAAKKAAEAEAKAGSGPDLSEFMAA